MVLDILSFRHELTIFNFYLTNMESQYIKRIPHTETTNLSACADSSTDTQKTFVIIQMIDRLQVDKTLSQMNVTIAVQTALFYLGQKLDCVV